MACHDLCFHMSLNKGERQALPFQSITMNLIHTGLPHSLAGNNVCHLLQLCLHPNQKRVLYFKWSHVSSNLARWGSLVFTWALMWHASLPETASALIAQGFFHLKSIPFQQREAQIERQNSSLEGQQRDLQAGEHSFTEHFPWESRVPSMSGLL